METEKQMTTPPAGAPRFAKGPDKRPLEYFRGVIHWLTHQEYLDVLTSGMFGDFYPGQPTRWEDLPTELATPLISVKPAGAEPAPEAKAASLPTSEGEAAKAAAKEILQHCYWTPIAQVKGMSIDKAAASIERFFAPLRAELAAARKDNVQVMDKLAVITNSNREQTQSAVRWRTELKEVQAALTKRDSELERVKGENDRFKSKTFTFEEDENERLKLQSDLTAARARIGELEKERECALKLIDDDMEKRKKMLMQTIWLQEQLALANAKAEEARRAGVKCFDESHPDDLPARIHAVIKQHERLWLNGESIYLSSYLAKAIFEMLNQPLK